MPIKSEKIEMDFTDEAIMPGGGSLLLSRIVRHLKLPHQLRDVDRLSANRCIL